MPGGRPGPGGPTPTQPTYLVAEVLRGEPAWTAPTDDEDDRLGWLSERTLVYAGRHSGRVRGLDTRTGAYEGTMRAHGVWQGKRAT